MKKKLKDEYKPVRIMDFDAWDIMFHQFLGSAMSRDFQLETLKEEEIIADKSMVLYQGSIPASLDSLQMWERCSKKENNKHMMPYYYSSSSSLKCSDALINVRFPKETETEIYIKDKKAAQKILHEEECNKEKIKGRRRRMINEWIMKAEKNQTVYEDFIAEKKKKKKEENEVKELEKIKGELSKSIGEMKETYAICIKDAISGSKVLIKDDQYSDILKIRTILYTKGFDVDTGNGIRHYVMYKRSASKAKTGSVLFIWDELYEDMMDWTWMGLWSKFDRKKEYDLTSLKAYEALVSSAVSSTVKIEPDQILLLESVESPEIEANRFIMTKNDEGEVVLLSQKEYEDIHGEKYSSNNKIWDGQALVDRSVFDSAGYVKDEKEDNRHGMMLLRNKFFKACAFNTNIQSFYREKNIDTVTDMFGRELKAEDIRMIVTMDSLKFPDKFAEYFFEDKEGLSAKQQAYEYWLDNISCEFGIVKEEKASNLGHGMYHEVSYQVLNTLPLDKDDMREVIKEDLRYLDLLRNDEAVILEHMENVGHSVAKSFFFSKLYKYFSDFESTYEYRDMKRKEIYDYMDRMKTGRIKVRGDFFVLCSMPVEMLFYSVDRDWSRITPLLNPGECYIKGQKKAAPVTIFRYPHISSGGVCSLTNINNKKTSLIDRYMNLENEYGSNVIIISPWQSNIMVRLGGADFDSDSVLYIRDRTIERAARDLLDREKFGVLNPTADGLPVVEVDERLKGNIAKDTFDKQRLSVLDHNISSSAMTIGELSNDAQLFNSYFWEEYFKEDHDDGYLRHVYNCSLMLAALNELEIDSAKHNISLNIKIERKKIRKTRYKEKDILERADPENGSRVAKILSPYFLYRSKKKKNAGKGLWGITTRKDNIYWNCPVDHISEILSEEAGSDSAREHIKRKGMTELLLSVTNPEYKGKATAKQLNELYEMVKNTVYDLERLDDFDDDKLYEREDNRERIQSECLAFLQKKKISAATVFALFKRGYAKYSYDSKDLGKGEKEGKKTYRKGDYKFPEVAANKKIRHRYLGFISSLIETMIPEILIPDICRRNLSRIPPEHDEGSIELWGEKYYYFTEHPEYNHEKNRKIQS